MRMGRLPISRGFPSVDGAGEAVRFAIVEPSETPPQIAADALAAVHVRLNALERLTRRCESGALTIDEFLAEKAAILGHRPSNLTGPRPDGEPPISFVPVTPRTPKRGKSLLGQLGWMIVPLGLVGGLGLTALSQHEAAAQSWQEALRLLGL